MSDTTAVTYEVRGRVGVITLRRPEARNAVNGAIASGIEAAIDALEDDPDVWAGVLIADGPVFCAGADLKVVASAGGIGSISTERGGFGGIATRARSKPLIAGVDAPALAGGFEIVLSCDLVVASTAATFGLPEVRLGLLALAGGLYRLPAAVGARNAMYMVLTGDQISAEAALEHGLVCELVEPGEAAAAAVALAERICTNAPLAVRASRTILASFGQVPLADLTDMTAAAAEELRQSEDSAEGPRSFIEKRAPRWLGR